MGREMERAHPSAVERVGKRIEHWRRTRPRRTAMPEGLWAAAVSLAAEHGPYRVARALRVDYATLKLRLIQAGADRAEALASGAAFVEVHAGQVFGGGSAPGAVVEVWGGQGSRMRVEFAPGQPVDEVGLLRAFLEGAP